MATHEALSTKTQRTTFAAGDILGFQRGGAWNYMESDDLVAAVLALDPGLPRWSAWVSFTDAQVKAWPTTPLTVLAAPGDNKMILPLMTRLRMEGGTDYENISASAVLEVRAGRSLGLLDNSVVSGVAGLLAGLDVSDPAGALIPFSGKVPASASAANLNGQSGIYDSDVENQPLTLRLTNAAGDLTGGDAGNVLKAQVYYCTLALP